MNKIKLSTALKSVNPDVNVRLAGNGWIMEFSGRNHEDDWKNLTILCEDIDTVTNLLVEHSEMPSD
jgi:hypothetical protein